MTKADKLIDAIGRIDDALVPDLTPAKKSHKVLILSSVAVVCAAALLLVTLFPPKFIQKLRQGEDPGSEFTSGSLLAAPNYPDMAPYPDETSYSNFDAYLQAAKLWRESRQVLCDQPYGYQDGYNAFLEDTFRALIDPDLSENYVFSPLNLYLTLSMAAEISDGQSRAQILEALHQKDIETLRANAKALFEANYVNDGMATCLMANSLWTNNKLSYNQETMDRLAETYYASAYSGDPLSPQYSSLLQDWINSQTDGLLSDYVDNIQFDPQMVLALASTVNYSGKWNEQFNEQATKAGTFHSPGQDVTCDFMKAELDTLFYRGENFDSISLGLCENGYMRLILPNEGTSPTALFSDEECMAFLLNKKTVTNKKLLVTLSLPKFDISSSLKLKEPLEKLGITDIFDSSRANFSPLGENTSELYVSQAEQDARVMIDEKGCKASSVTIMEMAGAALLPDERIDFVLDRPFIFEIVSNSGAPLFIGIVNQPGN